MTLKPEHIVEALNKTPELKRRLILRIMEELLDSEAFIAPFRFRDVPDIYAGKMGRGRFRAVRPCWGVRFYYSFSLPSRNSMTRCAAYLAFAVSWRCQAP